MVGSVEGCYLRCRYHLDPIATKATAWASLVTLAPTTSITRTITTSATPALTSRERANIKKKEKRKRNLVAASRRSFFSRASTIPTDNSSNRRKIPYSDADDEDEDLLADVADEATSAPLRKKRKTGGKTELAKASKPTRLL